MAGHEAGHGCSPTRTPFRVKRSARSFKRVSSFSVCARGSSLVMWHCLLLDDRARGPYYLVNTVALMDRRTITCIRHCGVTFRSPVRLISQTLASMIIWCSSINTSCWEIMKCLVRCGDITPDTPYPLASERHCYGGLLSGR